MQELHVKKSIKKQNKCKVTEVSNRKGSSVMYTCCLSPHVKCILPFATSCENGTGCNNKMVRLLFPHDATVIKACHRMPLQKYFSAILTADTTVFPLFADSKLNFTSQTRCSW